MTPFEAARHQIKTTGQTELLDRFLTQAPPMEAAAPFLCVDLHAQWPTFHHVISPTNLACSVLTPDILAQVDQRTLNQTLREAMKAVCAEGNITQGLELLDRLVKAGARLPREPDVVASPNTTHDKNLLSYTTVFNRVAPATQRHNQPRHRHAAL